MRMTSHRVSSSTCTAYITRNCKIASRKNERNRWSWWWYDGADDKLGWQVEGDTAKTVSKHPHDHFDDDDDNDNWQYIALCNKTLLV